MATIYPLSRIRPVYEALRLRAQVDHVSTASFHAAIATATRVLGEGRSSAIAITEGLKAMRPLRAVRAPGGAA